MCKMKMRINTSGAQSYRADLYDDVAEALGHGTRSGGLDEASRFVLSMLGDPSREGSKGVLERALEHEDMTPELAEVLSTDQVSLEFEISEHRELVLDE